MLGMRPYGASKQLDMRRQKALRLLKRGKSVAQVAAQVGVTRCSVYRWRREKRVERKNTRPPGKPAYVSSEQINQLKEELLQGAYAHGYSEDYWNLDRIGHLIWDLFGIRYTPSGVWRSLDRMNWSWQKVQRLAIQRNDEAIAKLETVWLATDKKSGGL
ncbi:MAG: transposase [Chloroflexi bacterium]|nr:transposase [Chloroflexota bacterium]